MDIEAIKAELTEINGRARDLQIREIHGHERTAAEQAAAQRDGARNAELMAILAEAMAPAHSRALGSMDPAAYD